MFKVFPDSYMTVKQASEKWNISKRRVRILCRMGEIPGVSFKDDSKEYMIPLDAIKPQVKLKQILSYCIDYELFYPFKSYERSAYGRSVADIRIIAFTFYWTLFAVIVLISCLIDRIISAV